METARHSPMLFLFSTVLFAIQPVDLFAQPGSTPPAGVVHEPREARDGQRDFDWEIGTWRTQLKRLDGPLTGSTTWIEYDGTSVAREVWDGRANLLELDVTGPKGRIVGLSLRLYNPQSKQWSLNFASVNGGTLTPPTIGDFRDGRGEFYGQETYNGRVILVRFIITPVSADVYRFEQAFSDDGGRTWELNWIATDTRVRSAPR